MVRPMPLRCPWLGLATVILITVAIVMAALMPSSPASAAVTKETAAERIAEEFGVEVLRVRPGERDGRPVWLLTVMQPEGSSNATFQVHILAVDQESGDLLPSFRHRNSGYDLPPPAAGGGRPF